MNKIKKYRLVRGLQQKELAEKLGVSSVAVCKWEHDLMFPNAKRLKQLAKTLGTTVEKLLPDSNGKEAS